jgi:hypothetical protein
MQQTLLYPNEIIGFGVGKPSPLASRMSADSVAPHLLQLELIWLEPVLGKKMLDDMKSKMSGASNNNPNAGAIVVKFPNDPNYETLFEDYILPYMGNAFSVYYLPFSKVTIGANGAQTLTMANANPAETSDLIRLESTLKDNALVLRKRILDFLCENKANYPLYDSRDCDCKCEKDKIKNNPPTPFFAIGGNINY